MRIKIDDRYSVRALEAGEPGKPCKLVLEKEGWLELDGIRQMAPLTVAVYDSPVLLIRDLVSDITGQLILKGQMNGVASYIAETRRIAEMTQTALDELSALQAKNV